MQFRISIHATLASAARDKHPHEQADFALSHAMGIFVALLKVQSKCFGLDLDKEISRCEEDLVDVWMRS
jgi:hypothetical protein